MDGYVTIGTELDTKDFDSQIKILERKLNDLEATANDKDLAPKEGTQEYLELNEEIEKARNKLIDLKKKQENYNQSIREIEMAGFNKIKESISSIGKGIEKTTKKVRKWALAIFGIRSAYMMIRQAMSTISSNDEQLKADIDYIKNAIAYTLEPIVRGIVDLVKQLMQYIGYIIYQWTGYNIFENANKSLQKTNKQANELKKTLSSFDEMNILGDNSSAEQTATPSFDLTNMEDVDAPGWVKFIAKNKDGILALLSGVVGYLTSIKLGVKGIKALGIGVAIAGIIYSIEKIIDFMNDPTFENFTGILEGISVAVIGIGIAFGNLPLAIAGAIALIIIQLVKNFDNIKGMFNDLIKWLDEYMLGGLRRIFGPIGDLIYLPIKVAIGLIYDLFNGLIGGLKKIIDGIVLMFKGDFIGGIIEVFSGLFDILYAPFKAVYDAVKEVFQTLINFVIDIINGLIDAINMLPFVNIPKISRVGEKKYNIASAIGKINDNIAEMIRKAMGGGGFRAKGAIYYPSKLPKLAVGGIINNPGPGVMYNGAYIGERGAEAVVPLTDSQQMELLGSTIGRYITVELTNITQLDGRQIARKVDKIQQNNNFVLNR